MQTLWQDPRHGGRRERELVIDEKESTCLRKIAAPLALKFFTALWLLLAFVSSVSVQGQESAPSRALAFTHVTVIDGAGAEARPEFTVVIAGARIVEIGSHQRVRIPPGAQIVDAKGKFLIPGLWDMHVHLGEGGASLLPILIANGVTSVREMGGSGEQALALRERVKSGSLSGPRIKATGLILESPRFIRIVERINGESFTGKRIGVANADDARRAIEANVKLGADFLKIRTSDITHTRRIAAVVIGGKFFSKAELQAMLEKAAAEAGQR